jgi:hypothetical protein
VSAISFIVLLVAVAVDDGGDLPGKLHPRRIAHLDDPVRRHGTFAEYTDNDSFRRHDKYWFREDSLTSPPSPI